jgi:hypothetical protein
MAAVRWACSHFVIESGQELDVVAYIALLLFAINPSPPLRARLAAAHVTHRRFAHLRLTSSSPILTILTHTHLYSHTHPLLTTPSPLLTFTHLTLGSSTPVILSVVLGLW